MYYDLRRWIWVSSNKHCIPIPSDVGIWGCIVLYLTGGIMSSLAGTQTRTAVALFFLGKCQTADGITFFGPAIREITLIGNDFTQGKIANIYSWSFKKDTSTMALTASSFFFPFCVLICQNTFLLLANTSMSRVKCPYVNW